MNPEGALDVAVVVERQRVVDVQVTSTRRVDAVGSLAGRHIEEALALLPVMLPICGVAHALAAAQAVEHALGFEVTAAQRRSRSLICAIEALESQCFQYAVEWMRLCGQPPAVTALRNVRQSADRLRKWAFPNHDWGRVGGGMVGAATSPWPLLRPLHDAVEALVPDGAVTARDEDLRTWAAGSHAPAAFLFNRITQEGGEDFAPARTPLLPSRDPAWFALHARDAAFAALPTFEGQPAESGSLASVAFHPVIAARLERGGSLLLTRLVARLAHTRMLLADVEACAQALRGVPLEPMTLTGVGTGTGCAETGRGVLAHTITVSKGRIVEWSTVAPTEWTFHPRGVVREALLGAAAPGVQWRADCLVVLLDPCVPCRVRVEEGVRA